MKLVTVLGTRPEIIRLSKVIPRLDEIFEHILIHTGQNYDPLLSDVFFNELGVRSPDVYFEVKENTFSSQVGTIISRAEDALRKHDPDAILILGDTNSGLSSYVAKRMGIKVFHMEAGNRCFDDEVPEEVNRRVIDHCSDVLLPYTERSKANLVREGIDPSRIYVIGNPIKEVLTSIEYLIKDPEEITQRTTGTAYRDFVLYTFHRAENVNDEKRLANIVRSIGMVSEMTGLRAICPIHPTTKSKLKNMDINCSEMVSLIDALPFFDFLGLEKNAKCVITDSGTVQEECCIFGVPNVTIRSTTERPETVERGSNIVCGTAPSDICRAVSFAMESDAWGVPEEYERMDVSSTVIKIMMSELRS
jgi:UDP-N-acetylglucosamine 2-epimerase (non-hydrolysing)